MKYLMLAAALTMTVPVSVQAQKPAPKAAPKAAPAPAPKPVAKPFDFMGYNTDTAATSITMAGKPCTADGDKTECTDFRGTLAGRPMQWISMNFYQGKLYMVLGAFGDLAYADVLIAFRTKYGAPAKTETRVWQSKGGAKFDNVVTTWTFKGGDLELHSMGGKVGQGSFEFMDSANSPPADKPKIDF